MKFDGKNLEEVINRHWKWICCPTDDEDRADFSGADLVGASISYARLFGANFRGANLFHACLFGADLTKADFTGANLYEADLQRAKLRGAIGLGYIPQQIPTHGSFIAWKRVKLQAGGTHYDYSVIAKLRIPEDAERVCLLNGECKASRAEVLEIQTIGGAPLPGEVGISIRDGRTEYRAGETVTVDDFVGDRLNEHTPGIFFYLDRRQAIRYLTSGDDAEGRVKPVDFISLKEAYKGTGLSGTPPQVLDYIVGDDLKEVAFALKHMPDDQAAAVVLKYWDEYPPETIAKVMDKTLEEVNVLWKQARERIARAIGG